MAYDPDATYATLAADVGLQETRENAGLTEQETDLRANVGYQETERERAEPGTYKASASRANRGGILTSGSNNLRRTSIYNDFAARRTSNQLGLTQGLGRIARGHEEVGWRGTERLKSGETRRTEEKDQYAREHPPVAAAAPVPQTVPTGPPPPSLTAAKGRPDGGDWYWSPYSNQWVGKARLNAERLKGK